MNNEPLQQSGGDQNVLTPSETSHIWRSRRGLIFGGLLVVIAGVLVACGGGGSGGNTSSSGATPAAYTIGGTASGLSGSGLVLQNNAGNDLAVSANGTFTFSPALASGAAYAVTVKTQPSTVTEGQTCVVSNGNGTVTTSNVTAVSITCTTTTINGIAVPPDPGEVGKATLQGIDFDNDGVRDDVQRYIVMTYPQSAKIRAALAQDAAYVETLIVGGGTATTNMQASEDAVACEGFTFKTRDGDVNGQERAMNAYHNLKAVLLNTPSRIRAFGVAQRQFNGTFSASIPYNQKAARCHVAPSSLPN